MPMNSRSEPFVVSPVDFGGQNTDWVVYDYEEDYHDPVFTSSTKKDSLEEAKEYVSRVGGPGIVVLDGMAKYQRFIENEYYWKQYEKGI